MVPAAAGAAARFSARITRPSTGAPASRRSSAGALTGCRTLSYTGYGPVRLPDSLDPRCAQEAHDRTFEPSQLLAPAHAVKRSTPSPSGVAISMTRVAVGIGLRNEQPSGPPASGYERSTPCGRQFNRLAERSGLPCGARSGDGREVGRVDD